MPAALQNERNIHHPNWIFPEAVVEIYCGDTYPEEKICKLRPNPRDPGGPYVTQFATSWVERGNWYNTYNIVLCPRFFQEKTSLDSILNDMSNGRKKPENASEYKFSWGHTIYHELMHLDPVIANEEVWDISYDACEIAKIANQNGCNYTPVGWMPPTWNPKRGQPHSLINADSWAFFASSVLFQKALKLKSPGRAINTCGIYSGASLSNYTADSVPEGILLPTVNRTDGTFDAKVPPNPRPENIPPEDPPTPSLPYVSSDLPQDIATPFNAVAYFATYTPSAASTSSSTTPPTPPASDPTKSPPYATGVCSFHMTYWRPFFWPDGSNPYEIEIRIKDNNKATIGWLPHTDSDNQMSWNVVSRLEDPLAVTPESQHDYVQFTLGSQSWRTDKATDPKHIPNCSVGDWDCSDDPCVSYPFLCSLQVYRCPNTAIV